MFRGFDAFRQINPVVNASTLICDDGTRPMDSTLVLAYAEALPVFQAIPCDDTRQLS